MRFYAMNNDYSPLETEDTLTKLNKERSIKSLGRLEVLLTYFSPGERLLLYGLTITLALSTFVMLISLNTWVSTVVPASGGNLVEGEVGPARFINPILTLSQPDEDITSLVYSGLMRAMPDGSVVPDLASSYSISPDGMTYTFTIQPNATFQDGTPVTADDVLFTVEKAQDPEIKSTERANWDGVVATSPDAHTVVFQLQHAYAPFIENTTLGILPKHLWANVSAEEFPFNPLNTHPVGSGPYKVASFDTDSTGSATRYNLVPFAQYTLGTVHLSHITFVFFTNTDAMLNALNAHTIDAIGGVAPANLTDIKRNDINVVQVSLPRVFGVFFNQTHAPALADLSARQALDAAIDKNALVATVLNGYGTVLSGPIPANLLSNTAPAVPQPFKNVLAEEIGTTTSTTTYTDNARAILQNGGWTFSPTTGLWTKKTLVLSFTLATADSPELVATANTVANDWRTLGVKVVVQIYPLSELNENVIRPRAYDAILFGEVVGRDLDLFAFWHSSQRNDPGLNLAMYANTRADALLAQARTSTSNADRTKIYEQFAATLEKDQPAVFLYSPSFLYIVPSSLQGVELGALTSPAERFLNAYQWYTDTARVWNVFAR